jgi:hypothetical protein
VEFTMIQGHSHTLGPGDVSEFSHLNLRMRSRPNGHCQTSEHTLGKGDDIGMKRKYK